MPEPKFLLVTGLARAGTTSLMQRLLETDAFQQLALWAHAFGGGAGDMEPLDQAQGDGDSKSAATAMAFLWGPILRRRWRNPFGGCGPKLDMFRRMCSSRTGYRQKTTRPTSTFQGLVRENGKVYLAKNNNALLRYPPCGSHNRDFRVVLMFREPLAHAASLLGHAPALHRNAKRGPFCEDLHGLAGPP